MTSASDAVSAGGSPAASGGHVTLRYWASARAAAGTDTDTVEVDGPVFLADLLARAKQTHDTPRFREVLACCAVMVGDRPVTTSEPAEVVVRPGENVEFLPPFAGG